MIEIRKKNKAINFEFKNDDAKRHWKHMTIANNNNPYAKKTMSYATRWANNMQKLILEGKKIDEIAEMTAKKSNVEKINGFMYGCAANMLFKNWKYGEELRIWYNKGSVN